MAKVIAIQSVASSGGGNPKLPSMAIGQTYDVSTTVATDLKNRGFAIDFDTALANAKCPKIIRTKPIVVN